MMAYVALLADWRRAAAYVPLLLALLSAATWFYVAIAHIRFPGDISGVEGATVDHIRRILSGAPLYAPPSIDFTAHLYAPLYYGICALFAGSGDLAFAVPRTVSTIAAVISGVLVFTLARRAGGSAGGGFVAVAILYAGNAMMESRLTLAHADSLVLMWMLGAACLWSSSPRPRNAFLTGIALALAVLTKQSALLVVLIFLFHGVAARRTLLLPLLTGLAAVMGPAALYLHLNTDGWVWFYTVDMPARFGAYWPFVHVPLRELARFSLAGFGIAVVALAWWRERRADDLLLWGAILAALMASGWAGRLHPGSAVYALLPSVAGLAVGGGIAYSFFARQGTALAGIPSAAFAVLFGVSQILALAYDPHRAIPPDGSYQQVAAARASLAGLAPDTMIFGDGFLIGRMAGAATVALRDVREVLRPDERREFDTRLRQELVVRRPSALVISVFYVDQLRWLWEGIYRLDRPLMTDPVSPRRLWTKEWSIYMIAVPE